MTIKTMFALLGIGLALACGAGETPPPADLILLGGVVATVDADFSLAEAVAVRNGRIAAVGTREDISALIGTRTTVLDCNGLLVLPGLIDAHAHLHSLGDALTSLDVTGTLSFEDLVGRVKERVRVSAQDEWIVGGRWDQNDWPGTSFPVHNKLSAASPDNPVYLIRVDGNAAFANRKALDIAGIDRTTSDPSGGVIVRKADGEPTGVLINRAMNLVQEHIPQDSEERFREKFLMAVQTCLEAGLTGVHEAGVGPRAIALYKSLIDEDRLPLRIYAMFGEEEDFPVGPDLASFFRSHRVENYGGDHFLSVRSIKLYFDGALGSRGAAFYEPYEDDPENRGLLRVTPEYVYQVAKAALEADMGVNTHCIGIRGNRLCLEAYARAFEEQPVRDHRFRIEHAQFVERTDVERFAALGVIPSMQPIHATSDMPFVEARVGEKRAEGGYAWQWFLDAGLTIPSGSDFPVEPVDPLRGLHAAVTRQDADGRPEGGWFPDQQMSIEEAIRGFTIWAAHAAFQEDVAGSIEVGKLADFTLLDRNILDLPPEEILETGVAAVIVGGKIRHGNVPLFHFQ
ncbi:MAG: amidohydrolase [Candidatus Aminicenantes bacterium]